MSIWWQAEDIGGGSICRVEVERETAESVWIGGRKRAKMSGWRAYFSTWSGAHQHLMAEAQIKVDSARRQLDLANSRLGNVKGMKPPAGAPQ